MADQQAGEQVETGVPPVVAHGRRAAVADLQQAGLRHPLQRLADRGPGDAEHLGEPALARQRVPDGDLAVDDLGEDLVEHLVGHGAADHGLQRHAGHGRPAVGLRSSGMTSSDAVRWRPCHQPSRRACGRAICSPLVLVVAAAVLGFWQVDAWQERRAAEARGPHRAPIRCRSAEVLGPDDPFPGDRVGQPVTVEGTWLADATVFVSGRERDGEDGYWMVSPLLLDDGAAIPVVLGWVADTGRRPGLVAGVRRRGRLAAALRGHRRHRRRTRATTCCRSCAPPTSSSSSTRTSTAATSSPATASAGLPAADLAQLPEAGRFTALRNLLYGVEWWVFGGFALFVWWRWVRDSTYVPEDDADAGRPPRIP